MTQEKNTLDHNLVNKSCPFCGAEVPEDETDFVYPTDPSFIVWNACCSNYNCCASVLGSTKEEALNNWNKRYENTEQN